eukprot:CAMPEP_0194143822 /NCGR_PEP_ID=MMETSP0152-20130528/12929_1 /TAXON_ID=1049557 /ORGANISM="Thalassiothrix antarctica, Strain L6-D1" /LENGTH=266 /DNA_ID=CAMNT_0038843397 /DNA_START=20 /DNA_END=820 /DNA_ORIENTATION=-
MMQQYCCIIALLIVSLTSPTNAFSSLHKISDRSGKIYSSTTNDADEQLSVKRKEEQEYFKKRLLELAASYDRGFGASSRAGDEVVSVIDELEKLNDETNAARGIEGNNELSPLEGSWRMIWTTAQDVLSLNASPVSTVGAIYQVFSPPVVTNIIDLIPKFQALLPPSVFPPSLVRAEVTTRASARPEPMRVGLNFEAVKLQPVQVLGMDADVLPPFAVNLPQIPGADSESSPGYFDVTYLDDELLIIRQNAPGGLFALYKTDNNNP